MFSLKRKKKLVDNCVSVAEDPLDTFSSVVVEGVSGKTPLGVKDIFPPCGYLRCDGCGGISDLSEVYEVGKAPCPQCGNFKRSVVYDHLKCPKVPALRGLVLLGDQGVEAMKEESVRVACSITRGGFFKEKTYRVPLLSGKTYTGSEQACRLYRRDGSCLESQSEQDQYPMEGYLAGWMKEKGCQSVRVQVFDGMDLVSLSVSVQGVHRVVAKAHFEPLEA